MDEKLKIALNKTVEFFQKMTPDEFQEYITSHKDSSLEDDRFFNDIIETRKSYLKVIGSEEREQKLLQTIKHLLCIINGVTAYHRHGQAIPKKKLDELTLVQIEVENEYGLL